MGVPPPPLPPVGLTTAEAAANLAQALGARVTCEYCGRTNRFRVDASCEGCGAPIRLKPPTVVERYQAKPKPTAQPTDGRPLDEPQRWGRWSELLVPTLGVTAWVFALYKWLGVVALW